MYRIHYPVIQKILATLFILILLTACSGIKTYTESPTRNLNIITKTDSGSVFSSIDAMMHVYTVDSRCNINYAGTVKLTAPLMKVGIPDNKTSYLQFEFASSGLFSAQSSSISAETLLRPKTGHNYDIQVSYIDDMYNVIVYEKTSKKSKNRELDLVPLAACGSTSPP